MSSPSETNEALTQFLLGEERTDIVEVMKSIENSKEKNSKLYSKMDGKLPFVVALSRIHFYSRDEHELDKLRDIHLSMKLVESLCVNSEVNDVDWPKIYNLIGYKVCSAIFNEINMYNFEGEVPNNFEFDTFQKRVKKAIREFKCSDYSFDKLVENSSASELSRDSKCTFLRHWLQANDDPFFQVNLAKFVYGVMKKFNDSRKAPNKRTREESDWFREGEGDFSFPKLKKPPFYLRFPDRPLTPNGRRTKDHWNSQQEQALRNAIRIFGKKWSTIWKSEKFHEIFKHRSYMDLQNKYQQMRNRRVDPWTEFD